MSGHYRPRFTIGLKCRACGDPFSATRKDARYCGAACRQMMSRGMRGKGMAAAIRAEHALPPRPHVRSVGVPHDLVGYYLDLAKRLRKHWSQFGVGVRQAIEARRGARREG